MTKPIAAEQDPGPCTFCQHVFTEHAGNDTGKTGCAAAICPDPPRAGYGRCAVYTSADDTARTAQFDKDAQTPVTLTPLHLANKIHEQRFGSPKHSTFASCACLHQAMWMLGFSVETKDEDN